MKEFIFKNRCAALGTKHNKEKVIAPLFKKELGIDVVVVENFNSDKFGTFTLDIPRIEDQKNTAKLKALEAMKLSGKDIAIASEGSFFDHPANPYITINNEVLVFIDKKYDLEIYGDYSENIDYAKNTIVSTIDEVIDFAKDINFPKNGIVVKISKNNFFDMKKGINTKNELINIASEMLEQYGSIWLETDLRAHISHSRMQNIFKATENLIENIKRHCPQCLSPGFHKVKSIAGLPCENCNRPTNMILAELFKCDKCSYESKSLYPNNQQTAYAGYCDYCNP